MNTKSLIWGIIGTVVWLLIIFQFAVLKGYELPNSLNELGDALAGIVAPIAFFWLILGYVQQGKQLEQNSIAINQQAEALKQQAEALNLQILEMKESVRNQVLLNEISRLQLNGLIKQKEPIVNISCVKCEINYAYMDGVGNKIDPDVVVELKLKALNNNIRNLEINVQNINLAKSEMVLESEVKLFKFYLDESLFELIENFESYMETFFNIEFEDDFGSKYYHVYELWFTLEKGKNINTSDIGYYNIKKVTR